MAVRQSRLLAIGASVAVVAAIIGLWLAHRSAYVRVNDARIAARIVTLSSEVAGRVTAVHVVPGDPVAHDELLIAIDAAQSQLELQEVDSQLTSLDEQRNQLRAQQRMVRQQVASRREAAQQSLVAAEADRRMTAAEFATVRSEYDRLQSLLRTGAVAAQHLETSATRVVAAQQRDLRAAAQAQIARANLAEIDAQRAQVDIIDKRIAAIDAQRAALTAQRQRYAMDLGKREVRAAFDGTVDQTFVDIGEYVSPGTRLLMYHDPSDIWVDANVMETDFSRLRLGAAAKIDVDAFAGHEFHGRVVRLGSATTTQFALLPNPNPSGTFTKVTQRLPVRIALEQQPRLLRPGMMVEVAIDVGDD